MIGLKLFMGHKNRNFSSKSHLITRNYQFFVKKGMLSKSNEIVISGWANMTPLGEIGNFLENFLTFLLSQITYFA